jgi:hypothetical protein
MIDAPDPIVVRIGDDDVTVGRNRDAIRRVELCFGGQAVVARESAAEIVIAGVRLDVRVVARRRAGSRCCSSRRCTVAVGRDGNPARRIEPRRDRVHSRRRSLLPPITLSPPPAV